MHLSTALTQQKSPNRKRIAGRARRSFETEWRKDGDKLVDLVFSERAQIEIFMIVDPTTRNQLLMHLGKAIFILSGNRFSGRGVRPDHDNVLFQEPFYCGDPRDGFQTCQEMGLQLMDDMH